MKTLFNNKKQIILVLSILLILLIFCILFIILFKFDKYYKCYFYNYKNFQFLVVNKNTFEYLQFTGKINIKYNDIIYSVNYEFYNKDNDLYYYLTDFNQIIDNENTCYILIKNINLFNLLKG